MRFSSGNSIKRSLPRQLTSQTEEQVSFDAFASDFIVAAGHCSHCLPVQ